MREKEAKCLGIPKGGQAERKLNRVDLPAMFVEASLIRGVYKLA
jgi:hypothetical protein